VYIWNNTIPEAMCLTRETTATPANAWLMDPCNAQINPVFQVCINVLSTFVTTATFVSKHFAGIVNLSVSLFPTSLYSTTSTIQMYVICIT
jgi:hypothetical protein